MGARSKVRLLRSARQVSVLPPGLKATVASTGREIKEELFQNASTAGRALRGSPHTPLTPFISGKRSNLKLRFTIFLPL